MNLHLLLLVQPEAVDLRVPGEPGQGLPALGVELRLVERQTLDNNSL